MAWRSRDDTHKEGEKSYDGEPIEKKTEVLSSKTDKSNNKTDSNSTTGSKKELKMTFDLLTKHIQECVRRKWRRITKGNLKNISHPQVNQVTVIHLVLIVMTATATIRVPNWNIDDARNSEGIPVKNQEKENRKGNLNIPNPVPPKKVIPLTLHHLVSLKSN